MTCSVIGCGRIPHTAGMCRPHYKRKQRHGDPTKGRSFVGDGPRFFKEVVLTHKGPDCLIWPFNRDPGGYGLFTYDGKTSNVHRAVCIETCGPPPSEDALATHSCGKGHTGCCSPSHLRWGTPQSNSDDMMAHGIAHGMKCLLSDEDDEKVFRLKEQGWSYDRIAQHLGYGASTVSRAYHRAKTRRT